MGKNTRKIHHTKRVFVQKKYRDALFRKIFSERSVLLELYNALNNTGYSDEKELTVYTIDDVIYLGYKNDVSFIVRGTLNLYEHQSILNAIKEGNIADSKKFAIKHIEKAEQFMLEHCTK